MDSINSTEPEFTTIPGFTDYAVSKTGVVVSRKFGRKDKPLKLGTGHWGHKYCVLFIKDKRHFRLVHRLVLETFVGPCPEGMVCRHFPDPNPANNNLENLSWGTNKENHDDQEVHGTAMIGEANPSAKLTENDVRRIRQLRKDGLSQQKIADQYNVNQVTISKILLGQTWSRVV